ncbi:hypothetical protein [Aureimonas sp. AU20]|uniref:hypothetical protein n=1 Tax=Aureimonas sp. AU20 TaxID=1349819 RepID=UPI000720B3EE|nr:hypothetical protein [Aureimonas sp. AU20]ALN75605.1 hypothetical protein M673_22945 [Aureimonas sp. AU20]
MNRPPAPFRARLAGANLVDPIERAAFEHGTRRGSTRRRWAASVIDLQPSAQPARRFHLPIGRSPYAG